jgi:hypothetical protein
MKRRAWCNIIAAIFSILFVVPLVMMIADRELPMKLRYGGIEPNVAAIGDTVRVSWQGDKIRRFGPGLFDCGGSFHRRFTDSSGIRVDTDTQSIQAYKLMGVHQFGAFSKDLMIPQLLPGPASYQVIFRYWCNPVQAYLFPIIHYEEPIYFTVIAGQSR